jgi:hypothetical protein
LADIVSLLPGAIDFIEVNHQGQMVTVKGVIPNKDGEGEIFTYARGLRGKFSGVVISSIEARLDNETKEIIGLEFEFSLE